MNGNKQLPDLIAAFVAQVREEHRNPERIGCPGRMALMGLATEVNASQRAAILDHVRQCAPCLDELRELRLLSDS